MKKKVFFFCASLQAGGAERVLSVLSAPLAEHYDEVQYLMWYDAPIFYEIDKRVKVVSVERESTNKGAMSKMVWLRRYILNEAPNIIISFSAPFNMIVLTSLLLTKKKVIAAERVDPRSFRWGKHLEILRNVLYRRADGILAQTEYSKSYFTGKLRSKTSIIYNPIMMPKTMVGAAIKSSKQNIIVSAARLEKQKRFDLLIETFAEFKKTHPDYLLYIYGKGSQKEGLLNIVQKYDIEGSVEFPGVVNDLWDRIKSARMFVMTSLFEGMSNSLIEAMCLGLPCISTKVSGAVDLIKSGENGILIDIDDKKELLAAMNKMADNPKEAEEIAKQATLLYEELNVIKIAEQWLNYIDKQIVMK